MNIDERLDRLTDRHEALALSLELLAHQTDTQRQMLDGILVFMDKATKNIMALHEIAQNHESRLHALEGGASQT